MKWQLEYKAWNILHNFFLSLKSFVSRFCNNLFVAEERKKCWILDFFNNHWELWSEKEKKNGMENPGITKKRHESIFIQWIFKLKKHYLSIVVKDLCTFSIHRCYRTTPNNLFFFLLSLTYYLSDILNVWKIKALIWGILSFMWTTLPSKSSTFAHSQTIILFSFSPVHLIFMCYLSLISFYFRKR